VQTGSVTRGTCAHALAHENLGVAVMVSLDEAMLAAIYESPDSDEPRLVYADALQERGDPRGELIALQCRLARTPEHDPSWPAMVRREAQLWNEHGKRWRGDRRFLLFERGFPRRVDATPDELATIRRDHPTVVSASIAGKADAITTTGGLEHLNLDLEDPGPLFAGSTLDSLSGLGLHVRPSEHIANLKRLPLLESLGLFARNWYREPFVLERIPPLALGLRSLTLQHWVIPTEAIASVANELASLESLTIACTTAEMALAMIACTRPGALRTLAVQGCGPLGAALAKQPALRGVVHLALGGASIGTETLAALLPMLDSVEVLDLCSCKLDPEAAQLLARWPGFARLRVLDLSHNDLGAGWSAFGDIPTRLTRLVLSKARLGDAGAEAIAHWLPELVTLTIDRCKLGAAGMHALAPQLGPRLLALDVRKNPLGAEGRIALAGAPLAFEPLQLRISHQPKVSGKIIGARYRPTRNADRVSARL
jgi:uncharacterized protein (TIGR02996 family)